MTAPSAPPIGAQPLVLEPGHWDAQYRSGPLPWETGRPSSVLCHVIAQDGIRPCQAIELGCGTGANAVWLASQGFEVTAVDLSSVAIRRARHRATQSHVVIRLLTADLRSWDRLGGPYDFFFDRGCYHAVRLADAPAYFRTLEHITRPGTLGLVLVGRPGEPEDALGPPVVEEETVRMEFGAHFDILRLERFRFDAPSGRSRRYPAWSCLVRRRG
jgi:2-polyprenyl-3-methyl-5-hydroxy-6-metoxy-1,4-benzoquinol methylase